jgi:hypothetical protein
VRDLEIPLVEDLGNELVGREEEVAVKKTAAKEQAMMSSIQVQAMVVELGPSYWQSAQAFGRQKGLLSPDEASIMSVAAGMPRKLPTEKQCTRLATIKTRLEEEGFTPQ